MAEEGLAYDAFIGTMTTVRPDVPASTLDIELVSSKLDRNSVEMKTRFKQIDNVIKEHYEENGDASPQRPSPEKESSKENEDPALAFMDKVPTELLFHMLQKRARPTPQLNQAAASDEVKPGVDAA